MLTSIDRVRGITIIPCQRGRPPDVYFARREKLNYATFAGWVSRAQRESVVKSPIKFAELRMPLTAPSAPPEHLLEVRLVDGTAVRGGRVADVVALIRALRS